MRLTGMKLNRIAIIVASGALLAGGAGAAVAATSSDEAKEQEQAILDDAAGRLGTTPDKLRDALGAALDAQLDKAVEDGRLTQEQADEIKQRREESGAVLGFRDRHHGPDGPGDRIHHGPGPHPVGGFEDIAEALGISERQLANRLRAGRTLAQIAKAEGKSLAEVEQAVREAMRARLEQAVKDGELTQAQADERLEHLDRIGNLRGGFHFHHQRRAAAPAARRLTGGRGFAYRPRRLGLPRGWTPADRGAVGGRR